MTTSTSLLEIEDVSPDSARKAERRARFVEFMLVGGASLLLFPISWLARRAFGLDDAEYAAGFLTFYAAYVVNDPHFSVTYLLFYRDATKRAFSTEFARAQRVRWLVAGVVVPIVLAAWALGALWTRSAQTLGWMIQLMFLLVGWHYAKQGFGVLTVLSGRRGISWTARERNVLLAHTYAGWAFAWANPASKAGDFEEKGVVYRALAHPRALEIACGSVLALSTLAVVVVLAAKWRRERTLPWAPVAGYLVTIWAWTIYSSIDPLVRYVIPALHSVQYLYFVWLLRRNEARAAEGPPDFGRPAAVRVGMLAVSALALGWLLFRGIPTFLDTAPITRLNERRTLDPLGETPWFAAFYVFVNVHHYFMDWVIWRRENPETRFLRT